MIEFRNVSKVYDSNGTHALSNVNIKIEDGEFVFVVGSSGAGKSTFLKLIMHEEKPTEGEIIFNDYSSATLKKKQVPYYRRETERRALSAPQIGNRIPGFPPYS